MTQILQDLQAKDRCFRVEFSGLDTGKVICWLCYKDKKEIIQTKGTGATHEEALKDAVK